MSALASLENFRVEDLIFVNWRLCRHCLQSEWPLVVLTIWNPLELFIFHNIRKYSDIVCYLIISNSARIELAKANWSYDVLKLSIQSPKKFTFWRRTTIKIQDYSNLALTFDSDLSKLFMLLCHGGGFSQLKLLT